MPRDIIQEVSTDLKKTSNLASENYVEGVMSLIPNCDYRARTAYEVKGVGEIFSGTYYFSKVRHIISNGYTVEADVLKLEAPAPAPSSSSSLPSESTSTSVSEDGNYQIITIMSGDTLWALSKKYNTTIQNLASINGIADPNKIYAGRKLKVPRG